MIFILIEECKMNNRELYKLLEIPQDVIEKMADYENKRKCNMPDGIQKKLFFRTTWSEGVKELRTWLGEDSDGIKILWEQLNIVTMYTYPEYVRRGISQDVFAATMRFCTRFLQEYYHTFDTYRYIWDWWFPRQISLNEFRIGVLEYEFIDGEKREVAIHIPSDADMKPDSVQTSLMQFHKFRSDYFSEWTGVNLTCKTWMLMPELQELMDENANLIAFQKLFEIDYIDRTAVWYKDWIFPAYDKMDENLPEDTCLQRNLKTYLLSGNTFGIAKGHIK
jgi:hypothetical protein